MSENAKYVVGVGAANIDVHGRGRGALIMRDSNPGSMNTSCGGVTRNILENLSRLGVGAKLISALGDDVFADKIRRDSQSAGIDLSHSLTVKGAASSSYLSVLDGKGDMLVAVSDMSIIKNLTLEYLDENRDMIQGAAAVVTDTCLAPELMRHLVFETARGIPVFVDPVSTTYARSISDFAGGFYAIKPNLLELEVLAGIRIDDDKSLERACDIMLEKGVRRLYVSLGSKGCCYADCDGVRERRSLAPLTVMVNATGGGDAFTAAVVYGNVLGLCVQKTLDYALAAGIVAISHRETINPDISATLLEKTIEERKA